MNIRSLLTATGGIRFPSITSAGTIGTDSSGNVIVGSSSGASSFVSIAKWGVD